LGPSILHVHAADAIGELAGRRASPVPLGQGTVDLPAVLAALDQHGYRGYFTVTHRDGDNASHEIARAVQYLRGQLGC
jgi:sugar phosphate isomerase/epimerase